jgi:hypothetical protein
MAAVANTNTIGAADIAFSTIRDYDGRQYERMRIMGDT